MCSIREAKSKKSPSTKATAVAVAQYTKPSDECIHASGTSDECIHGSGTSDECIYGQPSRSDAPLLLTSRLYYICQLPKHIEDGLFKGPSSATAPDTALVKKALIEAHLITNSTVTL